MSNLNVQLNGNVLTLDTTVTPNAYIVNRLLTPAYAATAQFYDPFFQAAATPTVVNLPAATVYVIIVINKNAVSGANVTLTFTPAGGSSETMVLVPGGVFIYFNPTAGGGITALSLTSASGTSACEVLVAA